MTQTDKRYLGEPVYVVYADGAVTRSAVSELKNNGGFSILLYGPLWDSRYFDLDEAIERAKQLIAEALQSDDITRTQERRLRDYQALLQMPAFRQTVLDQELLKGSLISEPKSLGKEVEFPKEYILPGQDVFALVTPFSHYSFSNWWRPRPYFILKTYVKKVNFSEWRSSHLNYHLGDTHFSIEANRLYETEEAAREAMVMLFAKETCGTILPENVPLHEVAEEVEFRSQATEEAMARVRRYSGAS